MRPSLQGNGQKALPGSFSQIPRGSRGKRSDANLTPKLRIDYSGPCEMGTHCDGASCCDAA
jgi:hypothetical protein